MMFSTTLMVRTIPKPNFERVDVLLEIKIDIEDIKTRSSRKTYSLNMAGQMVSGDDVRWLAIMTRRKSMLKRGNCCEQRSCRGRSDKERATARMLTSSYPWWLGP